MSVVDLTRASGGGLRSRSVVAFSLAGVGAVVVILLIPQAAPAVLVIPVLIAAAVWTRRDAVTVLGAGLFLTVLIPQSFGISGADSVAPSILFGIAALVLWTCLKLVPGLGLSTGEQPARAPVFLIVWSALASWAATDLRPISSLESRQAVVGLLILASCAGLALLAADGIGSYQRLERLMKWTVLALTVCAIVGIYQFATGQDIYRYLTVPGLHVTGDGATYVGLRSSFRRVGGTAGHPIEFAVVLLMGLPLAINFARHAVGRMAKTGWWACAALLMGAMPLSVSRTGLLCLLLLGVWLVPTWRWGERLAALAAVVLLAGVVKVASPGLLGTLGSLVGGASEDSSITHRTGDYAAVLPYIQASPWFGRGFHTFGPSTYDFLITGYPFVDNQYLMTMIETGAVGLMALLFLFATGIALSVRTRRQATGGPHRGLAHALGGSILVAALGFLTFDAMAFQIIRELTFLLIGCLGALWRIERQGMVLKPPREAATADREASPRALTLRQEPRLRRS